MLGLVPNESMPTASGQVPDFERGDSLVREVGQEFLISPSGDAFRYDSAVAYNSQMKEFLVVWHNEWPGGEEDIYARRITESGEVKPWFTVTIGPNKKSYPDVVYNATENEYLVVWMEEVGSVYNIWGRIIPWNKPGTYQEFEIISWPNRSFEYPKAAWNRKLNRYMVAWTAIDTLTNDACDVSNAVFSSTGSKIWGSIISTSNLPGQIDIVYNSYADEYLAVWSTSGVVIDLRIAALTSDKGQVKDPPGIIIFQNDALEPKIVVKGGFYGIVWQEKGTGNWNIYGKTCSWYMNLFLCTPMPDLGNTANQERWPDIATSQNGLNYIVTFHRLETDTNGIWAYYENNGQGEILNIAYSSGMHYNHSHPAFGSSKGLIVYNRRFLEYLILGRLVSSDIKLFLPIITRP